MVKRIFMALCAVVLCGAVIANDTGMRRDSFYAGINPLALATFLPAPYGTFGTAMGIVAGNEFGLSVYGGGYLASGQTLEFRLSTGLADNFTWGSEIQCGYIWYPCETLKDWRGGPLAGCLLRGYIFPNSLANQTIFAVMPEIVSGWRFVVGALAFDTRIGWNVAAFNWSTLSHSRGGFGFTDFPYNLNMTLGVAWLF
jgi:hypothetical protein